MQTKLMTVLLSTLAAYSTKSWVVNVNKWSHVVQIARIRGNRKLYRMPFANSTTRKGRPQIYGEELLLNCPSQPDLEEITTIITRKGRECQVLLQRWNDVIMQGSKEERTHEYPFDLLRVIVTDKKGKPVYRRPLWVIIVGVKRRDVKSKTAYLKLWSTIRHRALFSFWEAKIRIGQFSDMRNTT